MPPNDFLQSQIDATVQAATRKDELVGVGLLYWMAKSGQIIAPWWSKERDKQLRSVWKDSDAFAGAMWMIATKLTGVPFRVEPRDATVKSHIKQADYYNALLEEGTQFGQGWSELWHRFYMDLWTNDNGAFIEVIGAGDPDGPVEGPVLGLAHLDGWRCTRSSNPVYPVLYQDTDGKRYRFHHTRVMFASQHPSPASEMNGVGLCWLSRAINVVQNMKDIATYKQEKLGSRPIRGILKGRGISTRELLNTISMSEESADNQGLSRFAKLVTIASQHADFDLEMLDLVGLPDGFDEETSVRIGMLIIALTGGFPPRWIWPATVTGATKADAMYQHIAGSGGGAKWHLDLMRRMIGGSERGPMHLSGKVLPPQLKIVFDFQDDEQDRAQAEIRKLRSDVREKNLNTLVVDIRTAREHALSDGDITRAQFDEMELDDGRLPNGDDVLTLFSSADHKSLLRLPGVSDPLDVRENDKAVVMDAIYERKLKLTKGLSPAAQAKERTTIKQALAALDALEELYDKEGANLESTEPEDEGLPVPEETAPPPPPPQGAEGQAEQGDMGEANEEQAEAEEGAVKEKDAAIVRAANAIAAAAEAIGVGRGNRA